MLTDEHEPASTVAWLLVVLLLPGLGLILYLFLGKNLFRQRLFHLKRDEEEGLMQQIAEQRRHLQQEGQRAKLGEISRFSDLMQLHLRNSLAPVTHDNWVEVIASGDVKFRELFNALRRAKHYIHLQYFIIRDDELGREAMSVLTEQALSGVEVKVLHDGLGSVSLPKDFFDDLKAAGGAVGTFFPPKPSLLKFRLNFRNHRKICVVDGVEAFVGGFNIGDEYLGDSKKFSSWRDLHAHVKGSMVDSLEQRFLLDWRFATKSDSIPMQEYTPKQHPAGDVSAQVVSSGPDSKWQAIKDGYLKLIMSAKQSIYLETPYFIPDQSLLDALRIASLSGVDVRVITPAKPDHPFVYWAGLSYMGDLLPSGVRFYQYKKGFIHSKLLIVDGEVCSLGTANFDIRSFKLNFEVNLFIYGRETCKKLQELFTKDMLNSCELTWDEYQQRSGWTKVKEAFSRMLSPVL